ncbi:hypothetical protein JR316_0000131 [Psilocybe cubensis]|uniref:Fungal-type protein kinase domain-containing protein n=2 Tax=Psilocybe cubensis TaxID=181762 RepID=A0A8H7Y6C2_PSICU|nr:hypothetical protein JR316_0000131 [Psilocybe cubensis]KAH9486067.1 hypothetical protein JR316_0000131 [Psilocybe cubensis]
MADSQVVDLPARPDTTVPVTPVNQNPPPVQETPVAVKPTTQIHAMSLPLANEAYAQISNETRGHYLVGMDPLEFLDNFLPWNANTPTHYQQKPISETRESKLKSVPPIKGARQPELSMYKHYIDALDDWVTGIDNSQKLRFAHFKNPDADCASLNVDVSTYWQSDFPSIPSDGSCAFSRQQTHEEFKVDHSYDPFAHVNDEKPNTKDPIENATSEPDPSNSASADVADSTENAAEDADEPASSLHVVNENERDAEGLDKDRDSTGKGVEDAEKPASSLDVVNEIESDSKSSEEGSEYAPSNDSQDALKENVKQPPVVKAADASKQSAGSRALVSEVEKDTQRAIHTRGQIAAYAGVAMSMAFRSHFFSLLILGEFARFIRWDRRGAVVSTRFNYVKRPSLIFGFYLRFGQLSLRQRGFDTNAVRVPNKTLPDDVASAFDKYYEQSWHKGAKFSHHRNNFDGRPRRPAKESNFYRVTLHDSAIRQTDAFFVPAPTYRPNILNPFTRGSRRSLAFLDHPKPSERKMCFMKDSWQEGSARTAPEADIYRRLYEHGVPNIASMRLGDDVDDLKTETQEWWGRLNHSGRFKHFGLMVCHRLVLNTVARDLSTFTWCKVLLSCLADVVDAAQAAFKAGVLHRDLSAGNIMIVQNPNTKEWRGILIDWDMCLLLDERHKHKQMCTGRTGTWAFISARLLQAHPSEPVMHSLGDDMESIFWVLVYQVLRYTRHEDGPHALYKKMDELFNDSVIDRGVVVGGDRKVAAIIFCSLGRVSQSMGKFKVSALNRIFRTLGTHFLPRYPKEQNGDLDSDDHTPPADPVVNWDSPDEKWFSNFLRSTAESMAPLGITPTALESLTNDSKPPLPPTLPKRAKISLYPADYFEMTWWKDENDSKKSNENAFSKVATSSRLNHMDGLSASTSKRPLEVDDDDDDNEGHGRGGDSRVRVKRQRPL